MDAVLSEICATKGPEDVQEHGLFKWQRHIKTVIDPQLREIPILQQRIAELEAALSKKKVTV